MKILNNRMKNRRQASWLRFDRMLVESLWKQIGWILIVLIGTWIFSYACLSLSGTEWKDFCASKDISPWLLPIYLLIDTFNKQCEYYGLPFKMDFNGSMEEIYLNDDENEDEINDVDVNDVEQERA